MENTKRDVKIRSAVAADTDQIFTFIKALAEYERLTHEVSGDAEALRESLFGGHPYAHVIIATVDGTDAGFALYFFNYSTFLAKPGLYVEDLFVNPHYRGDGVGKALLSRLARIAVERRCGRMEWAVLNWNEPAIGFYKKIGGKPMDEWSVYRLTGDSIAALAGS